MNRTQRMWVAAGIAVLTAVTILAGSAVALGLGSVPSHHALGHAKNGVFMGVSDPNAPYDLRFIDEMTMHHQGAIMSAQGMIADSSHPELRDLAQRIISGQQRQVDEMQAWRLQWYPGAPASPMDMGGMAGMMTGGMMGGSMTSGSMGGMMGGGMMSGMMSGDQADRMFLRMMIPHHQLAIHMSQDALQNAEHEELKGLAREVISGQSAEITEMEGYLQAWYGEASTRDMAGPMDEMMQRMMRR